LAFPGDGRPLPAELLAPAEEAALPLLLLIMGSVRRRLTGGRMVVA